MFPLHPHHHTPPVNIAVSPGPRTSQPLAETVARVYGLQCHLRRLPQVRQQWLLLNLLHCFLIASLTVIFHLTGFTSDVLISRLLSGADELYLDAIAQHPPRQQ